MALALCLTLLPTAALAEETEGTAQTSPAVEEAVDPANGKAKQENQPAETKQENQPAEQEEQQEDPTVKQDEAVAEVQAMIDALPDAADLDGMDDADAMEVYEAFQAACDAYYDTLTEEQQAQLKNTEKLEALSEWFSQLETLAAGEHQDHCVCGKSGCTATDHDKITFDKWLTSGYGAQELELSVHDITDQVYGHCAGKDGENWLLEKGTYYLADNIIVERTIVIKDNVTICLNGKTIESKAEGKPVFEIVTSGTLTLTDCGSAGKVKHTSGVTGCGVYVNGGKFNLYGGSITKNTAAKGGGVCVVSGGTFNLYDGGTISGNTANSTGGGVYVAGGTFTMSGGTISGNTTDSADGGVCVAGGQFTMSGGKITGNTASSFSGGVGVHSSATFIMSGGTIGGTNASDANNAKYGGGVNVSNYGKFTMSGGEISGNKATENGGGVYMDGTTFTVSGAAVIKDNKKDTANNNVYLLGNKYITIDGTLDNGASIGVTTKSEPAAGGSVIAIGKDLTDKDAEKFKSDLGGYAVSVNESKNGLLLVKAHTHCICGGDSCNGNGHTCHAVTFTAWTDSTKLPETKGKYYLDTDVTLTETWRPADGTVLCLNGHNITMNGNEKAAIYVINGVTFTLCDCKGGKDAYGQITHTAGMTGSGVYVLSGGVFHMYGGSISNNTTNPGDNGGGVYMGGGQFTMYGGSITKNTAKKDSQNNGGNGGGVYMGGGKFTMNGEATSVSNNKANQGGGVYVSGGKFNMSGGSITGNDGNGVFVDDRATFTVSGAATVKGNTREGAASNVFLTWGAKITIGTGGLNCDDGSIGVTKGAGRAGDAIATGATGVTLSDEIAEKFKIDKGGYIISVNATKDKLVLAEKDTSAETHTHCLCGKTHTAIGDHKTDTQITFDTKLWMDNGVLKKGNDVWTKDTVKRADSGNDSSKGYVLTAGSYYLENDLTLSGAAILIDGDVKLCLNGHTIDRANGNAALDYVIRVLGKNRAHLTLTDCVGSGKLTGGKYGGVDIFNSCTLDMFGGTITGNEFNGGVDVGQFGEFNMYGGKITGNSAGFGGGVYNGGTVNMYGGEISDNTASNKGGGVYMAASMGNYQGGILNVSGAAKITDNKVNGVANNVYLPSGKTITIGEGGLSGQIGVTTEPKPAAGTPVTVIADTTGITGLTTHVVSDDNAYATAVKGSTIVLKVKGDGGETPEIVPVSGVALNKTSTSISVGNSEKLTATVEPNDATNKNVTWTSSDTSVATVAPDGTVTAVKAGTATITATAEGDNSKFAACTVTVTGGTTPSQPSNPGGSTGGNTGGSSSGGGGGSSSGGSDSNPIIKTETKNNADGSTTKTETRRDGSVTQTTTGKDGSVSKTETKPNGSSVTENKAADGSTGTVKTDKNGQTEAKTALSNKAVEDAKRNGEAVKAPVEVKASRNSSTAPTVKVELPKGAGETKVEIPVSNVKPGTVAVLVHPDGTEEIVKNSIPTEDGIQLTVDGNATVKIVDNSKGFIDTRNHWAEDAIDFVSARGLVNGMSATIYAPNNSTTRAQLWTILARQNDADLSGGSVWYEKAQNWAKSEGVSDGANPNAAINRAQMVTMLWRAVGQPAAGSAANFIDVPADAYYAGAVSWAVENGITTGVGGGKFDPTGACTRAQIATFLYRYMK